MRQFEGTFPMQWTTHFNVGWSAGCLDAFWGIDSSKFLEIKIIKINQKIQIKPYRFFSEIGDINAPSEAECSKKPSNEQKTTEGKEANEEGKDDPKGKNIFLKLF